MITFEITAIWLITNVRIGKVWLSNFALLPVSVSSWADIYVLYPKPQKTVAAHYDTGAHGLKSY